MIYIYLQTPGHNDINIYIYIWKQCCLPMMLQCSHGAKLDQSRLLPLKDFG